MRWRLRWRCFEPSAAAAAYARVGEGEAKDPRAEALHDALRDGVGPRRVRDAPMTPTKLVMLAADPEAMSLPRERPVDAPEAAAQVDPSLGNASSVDLSSDDASSEGTDTPSKETDDMPADARKIVYVGSALGLEVAKRNAIRFDL